MCPKCTSPPTTAKPLVPFFHVFYLYFIFCYVYLTTYGAKPVVQFLHFFLIFFYVYLTTYGDANPEAGWQVSMDMVRVMTEEGKQSQKKISTLI